MERTCAKRGKITLDAVEFEIPFLRVVVVVSNRGGSNRVWAKLAWLCFFLLGYYAESFKANRPSSSSSSSSSFAFRRDSRGGGLLGEADLWSFSFSWKRW